MGEGRADDPVRAWAESWLSAPRFQRYLTGCAGDPGRALALYAWNLDLGAALLKDISYVEIALRNSYDRVLTAWNSDGRHWLFDDDSPVRTPLLRMTRSGEVRDANALNRRAIDAAMPKGKRLPQPGSVISHLPFGFWAHLTDRAHERVLWIPHLRHAWPDGTSRTKLDAKIRLVNTMRNRIAHHEQLFDPRDLELEPLRIGRLASELFGALVHTPPCMRSLTTHAERFLKEHPFDAVYERECFASKVSREQMEAAVRSYFHMWVSRDFSSFDEVFSPACRYEECYGPIYEGLQELHAWIDGMLAVQRVSAWDVHELIYGTDGRTVAVTWTFSATEASPYVFDGCSLVHFDGGGRIDGIREFKADHVRYYPQREQSEGVR